MAKNREGKEISRTPKEIVPDNPSYGKISKDEFIRRENQRRENLLKVKEYAKQLEGKKDIEPSPIKEPNGEKPKRGRPKKIE